MSRGIAVSELPPNVAARLGLSKRGTAQSLKTISDKAKEAENRRRFVSLCEQRGIPAPVLDYQFAKPDRKFALDIAWPDHRLAIEVQGGLWSTKGAHSGGAKQKQDFIKFNLAALRHWRILQVVPTDLCTEATITMVRLALQPTPY